MIERFDKFLRTQREKDTETERVLELLKESSYAKQLRLERDVARVEKHKSLTPKLESLRRQRETEITELRAKVAKAAAEEGKLQQALDEARRLRIRAADEERSRSFWFDH